MPSPQIPATPPTTAADIPGYLAAFTNYELRLPAAADRRALGPARARALLERLALLPARAPVVQVAGSKGKGSCVLWMEQLLCQRGRRPAAYLSPHLERLNERIRIAGGDCDDADLLAGMAEVHPHLVAGARAGEPLPTFFDLWTTLAMVLARRHECDALLLEVGLGGPLDSTSAIPHDVGVLTFVELEHCEQLGDTVEAIAAEKARIARPDRPFVIGDAAIREQVAAQVTRAGARLSAPAASCRLPGALPPGQDTNLACAVAALESLPDIAPFTDQELAEAARRVQLAGRLETLPGPPALLLDGAHTRESAAAFARHWATLRTLDAPASVLVAFMKDKQWQAALAELTRAGTDVQWLVTCAQESRGMNPEILAQWLRTHAHACERIDEPQAAVAELLTRARAGHSVAVTGSFYLAGIARGMWP